jgi:glutaredoxin 3
MFCEKVKEFLSQQHVSFVERDIVHDAQALAELEKLGIWTTPITVIDGEIVVGFDRRRLQQLLEE